MMSLFSGGTRRNPYPFYDRLRTGSPLLRVPPPFDAWMIFDYEGVKWALNDHETFSSRVPAPQWFIFFDPPPHTKLRALISQAFTPAWQRISIRASGNYRASFSTGPSSVVKWTSPPTSPSRWPCRSSQG
jgi:cytochrome P450